jgi:hypothetical protein
MSYLGWNTRSLVSGAVIADKNYYQTGYRSFRVGVEATAYETGRVTSVIAYVFSPSGNIYFGAMQYFINEKDATASGSHTQIMTATTSGGFIIPSQGISIGCSLPECYVYSGHTYIISVTGNPDSIWSSSRAICLGKFPTGSTTYPAYMESCTYDSPESPWVCGGDGKRLDTGKFCLYAYVSPGGGSFPPYSGSKMRIYSPSGPASGQNYMRIYRA